jgi:hypothetical protein
MLNRPNPIVLVMGGGSMLTLSGIIGSSHVIAWLRYAGVATCALLGLLSIVLGVATAFKKKDAPPPKRATRSKPITLERASAGTSSRRASADDRSAPRGS